MTERTAYRVHEVCAMLGISRATLYRRVKSGELTIHKLGAVSLIKRGDVELLLKKPVHVLIHVSPRAGAR
jgi:excisionase family DNA binding protein